MAAEWYYTTNKQQMGPVSWDELRQLARRGLIKPTDLVWTEGMAEWVRANVQDGLFEAPAAAAGTKPGKRAAADEAPPPRRRPRRYDDDDDDDDDDEEEDDDRPRRRKAKKAGMATGLKIGLIIGGVVLLVLALGCAGVLLIAFWNRGPDGPQTYTLSNLGPMRADERNVRFQQGQRVVITSTNTTLHPKTDVDLYVMRGPGTPGPNNVQNILAADEAVPPQMHCRVDFIAPETKNYRVIVVNRGPGVATSCRVEIR